MGWIFRPLVAIVAATLTLSTLAGCGSDTEPSKPTTTGVDNGPGSGKIGSPKEGSNSEPRRGSAATGVDSPGPK